MTLSILDNFIHLTLYQTTKFQTTEFKAFVDNNLHVTQLKVPAFDRVENVVTNIFSFSHNVSKNSLLQGY